MITQLHSTTQPTATRIKHLAVSPRLDLRQLPASNIQLRTSTTRPYQLRHHPSSWRLNTTATDFTHTFANLTMNCHFSYIVTSPLFASLSLAINYSLTLNLNHLRGRHAYRLRNIYSVMETNHFQTLNLYLYGFKCSYLFQIIYTHLFFL